MTTEEAEPSHPQAPAVAPAKAGPTTEQPADTSTAITPTAPQSSIADAAELAEAEAAAASEATGASAAAAAGCRPPAADDGDRAQAPPAAADEEPAAGGSGGPAVHAAEEVPLSRNQQKKQAKMALLAERRAARKAEEKVARRAKQEEKHKDMRGRLDKMSPEEREAWEKQRMEKRQARQAGGQERKARLQQALEAGQRIIIDLGFDDMMTEPQVRSLCHQLLHTYAANGRAANPAHIILTSLQGKIGESLRKHAAGFDNWLITSHEEDYASVFREELSNLVYLTGDASEDLKSVDPSKAYIIGGLVDRNQHKNLCLDKAAGQGIATARLPLGSHLKMAGSPILTVNQVFEVLVKYGEVQDWAATFDEVVPLRKRADRPDGSDKDGADENGHATKKVKVDNDDVINTEHKEEQELHANG